MAVYLIERNSHDKIRDELIKIAQQYDKAVNQGVKPAQDKLIKRWNDLGMKGEPDLVYAKSLGNEGSSNLIIKDDTVVGVRNKNVTSVEIPDGIKKIRNEAFFSLRKLKSVTIPNSVIDMGNWAFQYCYSLASIKIPNSVTSIGRGEFSGCVKLKSVTIPDSVTSIGESAFWDCKSLTSITIPSSVTRIDEDAFNSCSGLTSITIPDSVTSIGWYAFSNCTNLVEVKFEGDPSKIDFDEIVFKHTPYEKEFNKLMKSKGVD